MLFARFGFSMFVEQIRLRLLVLFMQPETHFLVCVFGFVVLVKFVFVSCLYYCVFVVCVLFMLFVAVYVLLFLFCFVFFVFVVVFCSVFVFVSCVQTCFPFWVRCVVVIVGDVVVALVVVFVSLMVLLLWLCCPHFVVSFVVLFPCYFLRPCFFRFACALFEVGANLALCTFWAFDVG